MSVQLVLTTSAPDASTDDSKSVVRANPGESIHKEGLRAIWESSKDLSPTVNRSLFDYPKSALSTWIGSQVHGDQGECLVEILPPVVSPIPTPTLHPIQEWEGCVTEILSDEFVADLLDLTTGDAVESKEAVIPKEELSLEDRSRLAIGSFFWWVVGFEASVGGARKRVSQIVFPDLPPMTKADLDRGREWADWLYKRWGLE